LKTPRGEKGGERKPSSFFFDLVREVPALSKSAKKIGEAVSLFHESREKLEEKIKLLYDSPDMEDKREKLGALHSALAFVLWLHPSEEGFDKAKTAALILQHTKAALTQSSAPRDFSHALSLAIQLRILPFMVRSNKAEEADLLRARELAFDFTRTNPGNQISGASPLPEVHGEKSQDSADIGRGLKGIVFDGLGFSFYQFERDQQKAIGYLQESSSHIAAQLNRTRYGIPPRKGLSKKLDPKIDELNLLSARDSEYAFYKAYSAIPEMALGLCYESLAENVEGDESMSLVFSARKHYERAFQNSAQSSWHIYKAMSLYNLAGTYWRESEYEFDKGKATKLVRRAVKIGEEALSWAELWTPIERDIMAGSWIASFYQSLAKYSSGRERNILLSRSIELARSAEARFERSKLSGTRFDPVNIGDIFYHTAEFYSDDAMKLRFSSQTKKKKKRVSPKRELEELTSALEYVTKSLSFCKEKRYENRAVKAQLLAAKICYEMMGGSGNSTESSKASRLAKRYCNKAIKLAQERNWQEKLAESHWQIAQILDKEGNYAGSASYFLRASGAYDQAARSAENPVAYDRLAMYMQGWNSIELAKASHKSSDFETASKHYIDAANFFSRSRRWEYRTQILRAESLIEEAEGASFRDDPDKSGSLFQKASDLLTKFTKNYASEESDEYAEIIGLSNQLISFCNARVMLEKSKQAYRKADFDQSISELASAEAIFKQLASTSSLASDAAQTNELNSLASLCEALRTLQEAQKRHDAELYLKAKNIFAKATEASSSKSLKPLLSGLEGFSSFLYYSDAVEKSLDSSLDVEKVMECNKSLERAEQMFRRLGNKSFLDMLRASKHILEATIKMNAAEREIENAQERESLYRDAEKSLSHAQKYFESLGSWSRVKEELKMITAVRNHQRLIPIAHDIIAELASTQIIYSAISSSSSMLERAAGEAGGMTASAYLDMIVDIPQPHSTTADPFFYTVTISNLGKRPAFAVRIDEVAPEGFEIVRAPYTVLENRSLKLNFRIEPSATKTLKLECRPLAPGDYAWQPSLIYLDDERNYKATKPQTTRAAIEPSDTTDFTSSLENKAALEQELRELSRKKEELGSLPEQELSHYYELKEKVSAIEEKIARMKNEYGSLVSQYDKVRGDIVSLRNQELEATAADILDLEQQEKLLLKKIERRKGLLEQAHLL
jgi:hypothetical protein